MASRSLGTLTLDLVAKIGGFEQGMDKGARSAENSMKRVQKSVGDARVAIVGALGGLGAVIFADWVSEGAKASVEIGKLALLANTTATEFQKLAFGAGALGVSSEKLGDIYKDVNDKIGDYLQNGGGELKDFFTNIAPLVGVTADQFKNLSGPQALGLYVSSLEKAKVSQADMTFYLEAIANDATSLLPLLRNNSEGFKEWGATAEQLGLIMSGDTLAASQQLAAALYIMDKTSEGLKDQIGASLAPTMSSFASILLDTTTNGQAATVIADILSGTLKGLAATGAGVYASFQLIGTAIGGVAAAAQLAAQGEFTQAKKVLSDLADDLDAVAQRAANTITKIQDAGNGGPLDAAQTKLQRLSSLINSGRMEGGIAGRGGNQGAAGAKAKAYTEAADVKLLDNLREQEAALKAQSVLIDGQTGKVVQLGQQAQALAKWEQQLADIKSKQTLTADQKVLLASADQITAQYRKNAALEKEVELRKKAVEEAAKLRAFTENLNAQLASEQADLATSVASVGMGSKAAQRFQEMANLRQQYQQQQDALLAQRNSGDITQELYEKETLALRDALDERLAMQEGYYQQLDTALGDWTNGAQSAYQDYLDSAADVAGQTHNLFSNAFSNAEDALVDFVKTGKLSFKDLADSIVSDLIRIQIRKALAGAIGAAAGTSWGAGIASVFQADGGAWMNGVQLFANGGAFTNGVVTKPTAFGMAGGMGVMGEAGPEAIMPLTRGADGSLGVKAMGALSGNALQSPAASGEPSSINVPIQVMGTADEATLQRIRQAAEEGARAGYQLAVQDVKRNGPLMQMIRKQK
nr:MAG TPA: tail tape measure [Caudoviricetes sp.]